MLIKNVDVHDYEVYRALRLAEIKDLPHPVDDLIEEAQNQPSDYWKELTISRCELHALFIAEVDKEVVGCVYGMRSSENEAKGRLAGLWVSSEYRRKHYGRALLDRYLNWAESKGNSEVSLWVNENNYGAIELYVQTGFQRTGKEHYLIKNDLTKSDIKALEMTIMLD